MHHIQGCDRNQTLLLPNSVDDYIGPDNPVRFVEAFLEQFQGPFRGEDPGDFPRLPVDDARQDQDQAIAD